MSGVDDWVACTHAAGRCVVCGSTFGLDGHHVIPKQRLKRLGLEAHLWDRRNHLCVCRWHHAQHENAMQRIPRRLLSAENEEFARELGVDWVLDKLYTPG